MNSDLSSPRLGERALRLLDELNNLGLAKRILGEVDVFQIDETHELYGHMNINYVRVPALPVWENYGRILERVAAADFFVSTGEVLLPKVQINGGGNSIDARVEVRWTFPLAFAEIVWGDGATTHRTTIPLGETRQFGRGDFHWTADAPGWRWARVAVWDVAGNGAFVNPVSR